VNATWKHAGQQGTRFNRIVIEARLAKQSEYRIWKRPGLMEDVPFCWNWLTFQDIYRGTTRYGGRYTSISEKMWVKVRGWGDVAEALKPGRELDFIRAEGWITVGKSYFRNTPHLEILCSKIELFKDVEHRASAWKKTSERQRAGKRLGKRPFSVTNQDLRDEERQKLIARGLIKPSLGDAAYMPKESELPDVDLDSLDLEI